MEIKGKMVNVFKIYFRYKTHTKLFSSLALGDTETRIGSYSFPTAALPSTVCNIFLQVIFKLWVHLELVPRWPPLSQPRRLESSVYRAGAAPADVAWVSPDIHRAHPWKRDLVHTTSNYTVELIAPRNWHSLKCNSNKKGPDIYVALKNIHGCHRQQQQTFYTWRLMPLPNSWKSEWHWTTRSN